MSDVIPEVTTETLQAFADAWNRHDIDALMSFLTENCLRNLCRTGRLRDAVRRT
jgi:ketosteroid isomerase-like protein